MTQKPKQAESKFSGGQLVRFTDAGMAKYRGNPREEMTFERSAILADIARICGEPVQGVPLERYDLVSYSDGSEAVYEEAYLEAV